MIPGQDGVQRVCSGKRSRVGPRSQLTPARKRSSGRARCPGGRAMSEAGSEFCSDSEDLFGDYDSFLQDSSVLAQLDHVENQERQRAEPCGPAAQERLPVPDGPPGTVKRCKLREDGEVSPGRTSVPDQGWTLVLDPGRTTVQDPGRTTVQDPGRTMVQDPGRTLVLDPGRTLVLDPGRTSVQDPGRTSVQDPGRTMVQDPGRTTVQDPGRTTVQDPGRTLVQDPGRTLVQDPGRTSVRRRSELLRRTMLSNGAGPAAVPRSVRLKEAAVSEEVGVAMRAMETVSSQNPDLGPFFGLPTRVKDLVFRLRGIKSLYAWQETCLSLDCVQQRRNLIYSLPTSGGKTLVAEILILRELLCRQRDCLLVLPYISLVQEKVQGLASLGLELDFLVEEYAGGKGRFPPVRRQNRHSLYVATIEKAHGLVNALVEGGRLQDLGLVVVDELHMLGDGSRGALLEMTLSKVQFGSEGTQIIGMSATLGNIGDLQAFLRAENYSSDFRPVELKEFVKLGTSIYEVDPRAEPCFRLSRVLPCKYSSSMQKADPDHIVALVTEVVPAHSCLVFCPTKKNCENVAAMICKFLREDFLQLRLAEKQLLLQQLKEAGQGSVCPVLRRTLPYGVAYHHGGLTGEERRLLEEAYSAGVLCLLTCTSTLAAGVNLPARRVVLRSPYVAADFLKRSQYKQMVGRAGRAGIDAVGESVLVLQERDKRQARSLVCAPMEECLSQLLADDGRGLLTLVLSIIGLQMARTVEQVRHFLGGTLLAVQQAALCGSLGGAVDRTLEQLRDQGLVTESDGTLRVSDLGRASFKGSVDLSRCQRLYRDLSRGLEALLLNSYLHLLYLVTPYDLVAQTKPDWRIFLRQFSLLSGAEQKMLAALGVPESLLVRRAAGQAVKKAADPEVVQRVYLALVLLTLLKETDLWRVADKFQLSRGFLQTLLGSAAAFCSCVLHFTQELETLWPFRALLTELTRRLSYCVRSDLIPLMEVVGVTESRAKQLLGAGYKTPRHLAGADPALLCRSVPNLYRNQARQIVASAKMLLTERAAALQEEVDQLLTVPPDLPDPSDPPDPPSAPPDPPVT